MLKAFFVSKKWFWWAYGVGLFLLASLFAQVQMSVMFNSWYGDFYNILQNVSKHTITEFQAGLLKFMCIAIPYCVLYTVTSYVTSLYAFRWREAITFYYMPRWRLVTEKIEGESQRLQEDTQIFAELVESLGLQVVQAIMTLIAFIPILWGLSKGVDIPWLKNIPGSLVWLSLIVSVGGLAVTWLVSAKLPGLMYNNQVVEASYRKELVKAEDDKEHHGTMPTVIELFTGLKFNYHRLFLHTGYLNMWRLLFGQFMVIVPYVIMGPGLFTGLITLGVLVQVSNSFDQVRSSFSLFIDNWQVVTKIRSVVRRLREFNKKIDEYQPKTKNA